MNEDNIKGNLQKVGGRVEEAAGALTGDHDLKGAGREDQLKGTARDAWGNVKDAAHTLVDHLKATKDEAAAKTAEAEHSVHTHEPVVVDKDVL